MRSRDLRPRRIDVPDPIITHAKRRLRELAQSEADNAKSLYHLQRQDSRIGFEASNHYYYFPHDLIEKHLNCHHILTLPTGDAAPANR